MISTQIMLSIYYVNIDQDIININIEHDITICIMLLTYIDHDFTMDHNINPARDNTIDYDIFIDHDIKRVHDL